VLKYALFLKLVKLTNVCLFFREISEEVTERWQRLVTCAEERHKLVTASLNFYKTAEQVCSVLDSLEREYRRDEDWCGSAAAPSTDELTQSQTVDKAAQVSI
jgi:DNA-binding SARP family transcriptional activator